MENFEATTFGGRWSIAAEQEPTSERSAAMPASRSASGLCGSHRPGGSAHSVQFEAVG